MRRWRTWPGPRRRAVLPSRVLRLTLLAPEIIEAILDGWQPEEMRLEVLLDWLPRRLDLTRDAAAAHENVANWVDGL